MVGVVDGEHHSAPLAALHMLDATGDVAKAQLSILDWSLIAAHLLFTVGVGVLLSVVKPAETPKGPSLEVADLVGDPSPRPLTPHPSKPRDADTATSGKGGADYFLAGRRTSGFAVALSLVSGLMSGISYLGGPGLSYTNGT
jgi:hypothetical protein